MQEHQPSQVTLETLFDNGNPSDSVSVVRHEKRGSPVEYRCEIVDEPIHTVRAVARRAPPRYVKIDGTTRQLARPDLDDCVDMLGTIYLGDDGQTIRWQDSQFNHLPMVAET